MKNFFLWVAVYIPGSFNLLMTIAYYLGLLDGLILKYGINIAELKEQCYFF